MPPIALDNMDAKSPDGPEGFEIPGSGASAGAVMGVIGTAMEILPPLLHHVYGTQNHVFYGRHGRDISRETSRGAKKVHHVLRRIYVGERHTSVFVGIRMPGHI